METLSQLADILGDEAFRVFYVRYQDSADPLTYFCTDVQFSTLSAAQEAARHYERVTGGLKAYVDSYIAD